MSFRRQLFLFHRWTGIVLCLFFALWFLSGLFMMYVEFPELHAPERRAGLAVFDFSRAPLAPGEALAELVAGDYNRVGTPTENVLLDVSEPAAVVDAVSRVELGMLLERPVYRIYPATGAQPRVVFADNGAVLREVDAKLARAELERFVRQSNRASRASIRYHGLVQTDQWTVSGAMNPHRPLHKFSLGDTTGTVMYVSSTTGEVVRDTHRWERILNYFGAVTHWLYPVFIRKHPDVWEWIVDVVSGFGTALAISGVWIGILRWRRKRLSGQGVSPYKGILRWHHLTGLAFGVTTITWVFSGLLSMNPAGLNPPRAPATDEIWVFSGKALTPADFPALSKVPLGPEAVEAELVHYDSQPFVKVTRRDGDVRLVQVYSDPPARLPRMEAIQARAPELMPGQRLERVQVLETYDDYYYSRRPEQGGRPLPVIRAQFADAAHTWFHVDPSTGQVLDRSTRSNRVYRWLYNGLHSFDILWLWERRPLWDIVVMTFSLGGLTLSVIGVVAGVRRLRWEMRCA